MQFLRPKLARTGDFQHPASFASYCPSASDDGSWVGIGGVHTGNLAQAGSATWSGGYGHSGPIDWVMGFMEVLPDPPVFSTNGVAGNSGDTLHADVAYNNPSSTTFFFGNQSKGTSQSWSTTIPRANLDGTTAEWIDEAPGAFLLRKSAGVDWGQIFENGANQPYGSISLLDQTRTHTMMTAGGYQNDGFTNTWHACS